MDGRKLYRSRMDRKICGVCGGLAQYFNMDATVIRLIAVVLIFALGLSVWAYFIAALIIPNEP